MKPLYKTTIVIWSEAYEGDPTNNYELTDMAREADQGSMYCSSIKAKRIEHPESDPDWDDTEFFNDEDDDDEE